LDLAPLAFMLVAGCHRGSPSTTLEKRVIYKIAIYDKAKRYNCQYFLQIEQKYKKTDIYFTLSMHFLVSIGFLAGNFLYHVE